jgi:hypothetical protein
MTFIESFEEQLVEAARAQRDAGWRYRARRFARRLTPRHRGPAIALAALLVGVPAAAATVGAWNPFDDAGRSAGNPAPSVSQRSLDPELVATLGVLRRPQSGADRGAATSAAARAFRGDAFKGAQLRGVRVLDTQRGIVLVPFERTSAPPAGDAVPGFDTERFNNVACVFERTGDGFAGVGCHNAEKIKAGFAISSGSGTVTGLVPDGVARVRLVRGDQPTEATVRNNLFVAEGADAPQVVEWLGEDGTLVKRVDLSEPPPTP